MKILHHNASFLHQIFKNFLARGHSPLLRPHPLPFRPPIPSLWICHCHPSKERGYALVCSSVAVRNIIFSLVYIQICDSKISAAFISAFWLMGPLLSSTCVHSLLFACLPHCNACIFFAVRRSGAVDVDPSADDTPLIT